MIDVESFKNFLSFHDIDSHESGVSLAVEYCPECKRKKFKVLFRVVDVSPYHPFFGRCQSGSCQKNYSSVSYLLRLGIPKHEVLGLHGLDPSSAWEQIGLPNSESLTSISLEVYKDKTKEVVVDNDITGFFEVDDFPNDSASKYAYKRGFSPELSEFVKIDMNSDAVVFVCRSDDGGVLGYQKRFVTVTGDQPKTKTSDGFKSSDNILVFPRDNHKGVVICEGPFTAISAWQYGFTGICTFGSGIGKQQMPKVQQHCAGEECVYVAAEDDEAGQKFFKKLSNYFHWENISVAKIIPEDPQPGEDLNDAWQNNKSYQIVEGEVVNPAMPDIVSFW